jgi:hypothetical protein
MSVTGEFQRAPSLDRAETQPMLERWLAGGTADELSIRALTKEGIEA